MMKMDQEEKDNEAVNDKINNQDNNINIYDPIKLVQNEPIELSPALLIALFKKPNDRMFVLQLESSIVTFINSDDQTFTLNPMNSYFRLLSHQVAAYHNLKHTFSRSNDNKSILLYKGTAGQKSVRLPLLQDLKANSFDLTTLPNISDNLVENLIIGTGNSIKSPSTQSVKKFKILKREKSEIEIDVEYTSQTEVNKSVSATNSESEKDTFISESTPSLEAQRMIKEKQYEEAKLKIFNGDAGSKDGAIISSISLEKSFDLPKSEYSVIDEREQPQSSPVPSKFIRNNNIKHIRQETSDKMNQYYEQNINKTQNPYYNFNRHNNGYPVVFSINPSYPQYPGMMQCQGYLQSTPYIPNGNGYIYQGQSQNFNYQPYYQQYQYNQFGNSSMGQYNAYSNKVNQRAKKLDKDDNKTGENDVNK